MRDFENSGDNGNYAKTVYNHFMDAAYQVADKVELIQISGREPGESRWILFPLCPEKFL